MIFKYKANTVLLIELGRLDYVVEISEIAIRDFLKNLSNSQDPSTFLRKKTEEYGIAVSYDKSNEYYNQIVLGNISNVYHLAEKFFYDMQTEYNAFSTDFWYFHEGKTKLEQVLDFFKGEGRFNHHDKVDDYLIDTFNYYHQLRIYFSHKKTTSVAEINRKHEDAIKHFDKLILDKYRIKNKPKVLKEIDFEDYFLFTQITKDIALQISSIGYPQPADLARSKDFLKLKKYQDNSERLINSVENVLKTKYGYIKLNDSDNLVDLIVENL